MQKIAAAAKAVAAIAIAYKYTKLIANKISFILFPVLEYVQYGEIPVCLPNTEQ